jgi:hypothetical protein
MAEYYIADIEDIAIYKLRPEFFVTMTYEFRNSLIHPEFLQAYQNFVRKDRI